MYGYEDDKPSQNSIAVFGLNSGIARLTKFEWINNGGAGGTEGEALDILISLDGQERPVSYRMFPVKKAFLPDNGGETTDPAHPEFIKAVKEFNATVIHIMHCFVSDDILKVALATPIANFKEFCKILMGLLPKDIDKIVLDIFMQYQWQAKGEAKMTYLELPKKMSYGRWLCRSVVPVGKWKEVVFPDPTTSTPVALKYIDDINNVHPFIRNGWFMQSNFANQYKEDSGSNTEIPTGEVATGEIPTGEVAPPVDNNNIAGSSGW